LEKEQRIIQQQLNVLKSGIKCCPVNGCYGNGNTNNVDFQGSHSIARNCPTQLLKLANEGDDLFRELQNENTYLTTELNFIRSEYIFICKRYLIL
jgi:hypothetical protein